MEGTPGLALLESAQNQELDIQTRTQESFAKRRSLLRSADVAVITGQNRSAVYQNQATASLYGGLLNTAASVATLGASFGGKTPQTKQPSGSLVQGNVSAPHHATYFNNP